MRHFFIIFSLLLAVVLQATTVPFLSIRGVMPNLALVLVMIFVVLGGFKKVWPHILLAGLFLDLFSGLPFGLASASLISAAYFIDWLNNSIFLELKLAVKAGLIVLGVFVFNLILSVLIIIFRLEPIFSISSLFLGVLYDVLITLLIFNGIKKIFYKTQL